jgi:hypothetical protein
MPYKRHSTSIMTTCEFMLGECCQRACVAHNMTCQLLRLLLLKCFGAKSPQSKHVMALSCALGKTSILKQLHLYTWTQVYASLMLYAHYCLCTHNLHSDTHWKAHKHTQEKLTHWLAHTRKQIIIQVYVRSRRTHTQKKPYALTCTHTQTNYYTGVCT